MPKTSKNTIPAPSAVGRRSRSHSNSNSNSISTKHHNSSSIEFSSIPSVNPVFLFLAAENMQIPSGSPPTASGNGVFGVFSCRKPETTIPAPSAVRRSSDRSNSNSNTNGNGNSNTNSIRNNHNNSSSIGFRRFRA